VASDPANAVQTSGNAHRARETNRRQQRFASITAEALRVTARRNANSAGEGSTSGGRSKTSSARANTSASITSDLFFPLIAPRSLAECRVPTNARRPPPLDSDRANGSHVIDVGSATATTPGYRASRRDN